MAGDVEETFGKLVRRLREERRWTQERLGEVAGLDQSTISAIERDRGERTVGTVTKLATAFGAEPLDWLVLAGLVRGVPNGNGEPPAPPASDDLDPEECVRFILDYPDPAFVAQVEATRKRLPPDAFRDWALNICRAWRSNGQLALNSLALGSR
jgi:transcriptional regulator with XRE-family HTH domain